MDRQYMQTTTSIQIFALGLMETSCPQLSLLTKKKAISEMTIDNSVNSTLPDNYNSLTDSEKEYWNNDNGTNDYVCANTSEKIFLLSNQEITKSSFGFSSFDNKDNARRRIPTDYAKASGAYQDTGGFGSA